jgi:hypothetical protein
MAAAMRFHEKAIAAGVAFVTAFADGEEHVDPQTLDALAEIYQTVDPWELAIVIADIAAPAMDRERFDRIVLNVVNQKAAAH